MRISIPIYRKIWWEGQIINGEKVNLRLMAIDKDKEIVLRTLENVSVRVEQKEGDNVVLHILE